MYFSCDINSPILNTFLYSIIVSTTNTTIPIIQNAYFLNQELLDAVTNKYIIEWLFDLSFIHFLLQYFHSHVN